MIVRFRSEVSALTEFFQDLILSRRTDRRSPILYCCGQTMTCLLPSLNCSKSLPTTF
jgi:hypothetical protein